GQRGRGNARSARGRHVVPRAVPLGADARGDHLPGQHPGRADPRAPAKEVRSVMNWRREGAPQVWLTAAAAALSLLLVAGLLLLVFVNGLGFFWPRDVARLELVDGEVVIGEIVAREPMPATDG